MHCTSKWGCLKSDFRLFGQPHFELITNFNFIQDVAQKSTPKHNYEEYP